VHVNEITLPEKKTPAAEIGVIRTMRGGGYGADTTRAQGFGPALTARYGPPVEPAGVLLANYPLSHLIAGSGHYVRS
jgi:hypothetical protein